MVSWRWIGTLRTPVINGMFLVEFFLSKYQRRWFLVAGGLMSMRGDSNPINKIFDTFRCILVPGTYARRRNNIPYTWCTSNRALPEVRTHSSGWDWGLGHMYGCLGVACCEHPEPSKNGRRVQGTRRGRSLNGHGVTRSAPFSFLSWWLEGERVHACTQHITGDHSNYNQL